MSDVVLLPNTDRSQQIEELCQRLYYYQILTAVNKLKDYIRVLPNTDRSQLVDELCQRLYYYHILTAVNKLKDYVRGCSATNYCPQSTNCRIMSEVVLLPYTDCSQQVKRLCQRYYQLHTTVNKLKDYVRRCTTTNY